MDYLWRLLIISVLIADCSSANQAVTPKPFAVQTTTPQCVNCPRKTTTHSTTTHSTLHTNHTTTAPTTAHTNHTTEPTTTAHTNHTTEPTTTAHTNHTTEPTTTAHTNHTTEPTTTAHTNHTTEPTTTAHTNHTTEPTTTAHTNHTTEPTTTAHTNHTTEPTTTAHGNYTTTPHSNHTTPRHTTPSPPPTPTEYFVNGTSGICLRINATFVLMRNNSGVTNYTIPPPPMTNATGKCGTDTANLILTFPEGSLFLMFKKDTKKNSYYLGTVAVLGTEKGKLPITAAKNLTGMLTPLGRSFTCNEVKLEVSPNVNVLLMKVKAQAIELQGGAYGKEFSCGKHDNTAAIVVGIVLLVLIVTVVVAYLIARKLRPRADGYQPL